MFHLISATATAAPVVLLAYGLSLYGSRRSPAPLEEAGAGRDIALVVVLKAVAQPLIAYVTAHFVLG